MFFPGGSAKYFLLLFLSLKYSECQKSKYSVSEVVAPHRNVSCEVDLIIFNKRSGLWRKLNDFRLLA